MSAPGAALLRGIERSFPGLEFTRGTLRSRDWASATFAGVHHQIAFTVAGEGAGAAADAFLDGLEQREFPMRGHVLIEIALVSRTGTPEKVAIMVEALTIEDA